MSLVCGVCCILQNIALTSLPAREPHASFALLRGDAINGFSSHDRAADPSRMLSAYWHAAATLNYMRMRGCIVPVEGGAKEGVAMGGGQGKSSDCIYTSHECLLLPMEAALTDARSGFNNVMYCCVRLTC
jgi:3-deoxy-D-arabino-heptulosonate 7-phosphate (DAHP) synthase class II